MSEMPQLPKMHEREMFVRRDSAELAILVSTFVRDHNMTYVETMQCLTDIMQTHSKYALRAERHPEDPSKPAGWA